MAEDTDIPMPSMMPAGATWRNVRRREKLDTTTRRLVLFAGVIGGGLLLLVGAWSLTGHRSAVVPVVEADARPLRTKPENPGGMQLAGQDDAIMAGGGQDAMAPPPESPAPQALRDTAGPAATKIAPQPGPEAAAPAAAAPAATATRELPSAGPAAVEPRHPAAAAQPNVAQPNLAQPGVAQSGVAQSGVAQATSGMQVQLAALVSEDAARAEWQRLLHRLPDLLGGRSPSVSRLERDDGKVFFRLRTGGFANVAQATSFCEKVRAKGTGCSLGGV